MSTEQPTGRELDLLIAELLFGWQWWCRSDGYSSPYYFVTAPDVVMQMNAGEGLFEPYHRFGSVTISASDKLERCARPERDKDRSGKYNGPDYSTNIADAWCVFEELRKGFKWCCLDIHSDHHYMYRVQLTPANHEDDNDPHRPTVRVSAETVQLAICYAALDAVEKVGALERAQGAQASAESFVQHQAKTS